MIANSNICDSSTTDSAHLSTEEKFFLAILGDDNQVGQAITGGFTALLQPDEHTCEKSEFQVVPLGQIDVTPKRQRTNPANPHGIQRVSF